MIEEKEKEKSRKTPIYLLIALSLITFVIATVSSTFAFFTAYIKGNEDAEKIELETADIIVAYEGNTVVAKDVMPGWETELTMTLKNITKNDGVIASYSLNWEVESNEINSEDLIYTVSCTSTKNGKTIGESKNNKTATNLTERIVPSVSSGIGNAVIESGVIHNCRIKIKLKETGLDQNELQNKTLKVKVVAKGSTNTTN